VREQIGAHDRVFGSHAVAVEAGEREDLVAVLEPGCSSCHDARHLVGRDGRQPVEPPLELVACDRRSVDTDEDVALTRLGDVDLVQRERPDPARLM
jgi:hypothetical protein